MKYLILAILLLTACSRAPQHEIVKLHTIDTKGMSETIQTPERLARYQQIDFEKPQPFQKVLKLGLFYLPSTPQKFPATYRNL